MGLGPLSWLRVVDCTSGRLSMAGGLLAEFGAWVVKVEPPGGDLLRWEFPSVYAANDRGKRSVVVDLGSGEGREAFLGLVDSVDVVLESWEPGVAEGLGVGYEVVHGRNPGVVYCSISGWGEGGLDRRRPVAEPLIDAWIGTMGEQRGYREGPIFYGMPMSSTGASYLAVIGVLGALLRRGDDGVGRRVATSLVDGALAYLGCLWRDADVPLPSRVAPRMVGGYRRCGDGEYLGIHTGAVGAFDRLIRAVGLEDRILLSVPGQSIFSQTLTDEEAAVLDAELPKIFASRPRDEWEQILVDADICVVPAMPPGQMFDHPQVINNEMAVEIDDPFLGPVTQIGVATRFSRTPGGIQGPAPTPGQHTDEVLADTAALAAPSGPSSLRPIEDRPVLDGVRVVDLGQYYAGPFGPRLLADLGADVIKLEPLGGDPGFGQGWGETAQFRKRSIAVDLKSEQGKQIAARLIGWADVIHHNMRPGVAERLGIGYEQACQIKADIIYDFAPGWGASGPYVARQGFAPMYSGFAGVAFEVAGDTNAPIMPVGHEDPGNGLLGAAGILAALLHHRRSGEGQLIEHSQLNSTMAHMRHVVRKPDGTVLGVTGLDANQLGTGPLNRLYQTTDGWLCIVADTDTHFENLCQAIGQPDLASDTRFVDRQTRHHHADELADLLEPALSKLATTDAADALQHHGVPHEIPAINNCATVMTDPANLAYGRIAQWPEARRGHVREVDHLLRISNATRPPSRPRPLIGQHTTEILLTIGYNPDQINQLYDNNTVR